MTWFEEEMDRADRIAESILEAAMTAPVRKRREAIAGATLTKLTDKQIRWFMKEARRRLERL